MRARSAIFAAAVAFALGAGCGPAEVSGTAYYTTPSLAYVSPGVSVVADYDYPIFYADNFYWRWYDGAWYRSPYYYGGWISVSAPPYAVARIDRPWLYSHYRMGGTVRYGGPVYYGGAWRGGVRPGYTVRPVPRGMRMPARPARDHRR